MNDKRLKLLSGPSQQRLDFGHLIDRLFWALITFVVWLGVEELKGLSTRVSDLNEKMAIIVTQVGFHEKRLDVLESSDLTRHSGSKSR